MHFPLPQGAAFGAESTRDVESGKAQPREPLRCAPTGGPINCDLYASNSEDCDEQRIQTRFFMVPLGVGLLGAPLAAQKVDSLTSFEGVAGERRGNDCSM